MPDVGGQAPARSSAPFAVTRRLRRRALASPVVPRRQHPLKKSGDCSRPWWLASLVLSLAGTATAARPRDGADQAPKSDNLTNPMAEKQSALRTRALDKVLNGKANPTGDNQVVKVGKGQYVELAREGEDSIWTVLGEFGDQASNPDLRRHGGRRTAPQPDPGARSGRRQHDDLEPTTSARPYYENLLFSEAAGDVSMRNYYIEQSSQPLHRQRRRHRLGARSRATRRTTARTTATTSSAPGHVAVRARLGRRLVRRAGRAGQTAAQINAYLATVRRLGSLRLRRRRQLRRARRLHRPLPVGPRRRGRGDRRRRAGHRRHLEPPLVRLLQRQRPGRPRRSTHARRRPGRRHATSGSATTRSSRRTAASASSRTSSATTSACPTCTTRAATPVAPRTRPASGRCISSGSYGSTGRPDDGIGSQADPHGRLREVPARLVELRGRLRRRAVAAQAGPGRVQHQAGAGRVRRPARQASSRSTSAIRTPAARATSTAARATTSTTR